MTIQITRTKRKTIIRLRVGELMIVLEVPY